MFACLDEGVVLAVVRQAAYLRFQFRQRSMTIRRPYTNGRYNVKRLVARYVSRKGGTACSWPAPGCTKLWLMKELITQMLQGREKRTPWVSQMPASFGLHHRT